MLKPNLGGYYDCVIVTAGVGSVTSQNVMMLQQLVAALGINNSSPSQAYSGSGKCRCFMTMFNFIVCSDNNQPCCVIDN